MIRFIACLAFILTNSVMAQAATTNGTIHLDTMKWVATYSGETEVDGLPVVANLEEAVIGAQIPEAMVGMNLAVPSLTPAIQKAHRLTLIVSHNPRIQATYVMQGRTISMDGAPKYAYVSDLDAGKDFHFVITKQADGSAKVTYTRKVTDGSLQEGSFELAPVAK